MDFSVPVLVSKDERNLAEILLPGLSSRRFAGPSLAVLLDDAAIHLMEVVPKEEPRRLLRYAFNPSVELRRVKVEVTRPTSTKKNKEVWKGRISVILSHRTGEAFWTAVVPRLGDDTYAVASPGAAGPALARILEKKLSKRPQLDLDALNCRSEERLEILSFEADLPTLLPSQPKRHESKKKKKKKQKEAEEAEEKEKKRILVAPRTLSQVGVSLTHRALDGRLNRAFLREELVREVLDQMPRAGSALLLVGRSGVGKTAIVHEAVRRLVGLQSTGSLLDRQDLWQVDGNRIIAGMSIVGAWENRLRSMIEELTLRRDILYVTDLPALVYTGRSAHGDSNVAQVLEPYLARGEVRIIGECTHERLARTREEAPGFFARFRVIDVAEMNEDETLFVVLNALREMQRKERVTVEPDALEAILALVRRFEANLPNPGKTVSLLLRALSDHETTQRDELARRKIRRADIVDHYARHSGLPKFVLWEEGSRPARKIEDFFEHRIVEQPAAVSAATDAVVVVEQGLNDPSRPIATYLFVGPTGVGKTETAKAIAELLFGAADRLVRFDMSELMAPHSVVRLFGDRDNPDGELTRRIERQPFAVILLDEIEKAHPNIFDALLQVLGEGRLTNARGKTVDFSSTVIIMTSNLGVREAERSLGFETGEAVRAARYREAAERFFRPEMFNRIDRIVPFGKLSKSAIVPLASRLLKTMLSRRGLRRSGVVVDVEPEVAQLIVEQGFDDRWGARSVKRVLEQKLAVPLAEHLIAETSDVPALVRLFVAGGELGLEVHRLHAAPLSLVTAAPLDSWPEVQRRYDRLATTLTSIEESEVLDALRYEQTRLVSERSDDDRLGFVSAIFDSLADLQRTLPEFAERWLHLEQFQEDVRADGLPQYKRDYEQTRLVVVPEARVVQTQLGVLREQTKEELSRLELEIAALTFRVEKAYEHGDTHLMLRVVPATADGTDLARLLRKSYASAGASWGGGLELDGAIVELHGPGIGELFRPELGWHLGIAELGPDQIRTLIRVERVESANAPLLPIPEMPLVRTFEISELPGPDAIYRALLRRVLERSP
jgi:ATP-dependent Clp protease ATP-binding subunit ClpC